MNWSTVKKSIIISQCLLFICMPFCNSEEYRNSARVPLSVEFADYMQQVREKIQNNWIAPDVLETGHAVIVFRISDSGELISLNVKESSGNVVFDEAAIEALNKSVPFPSFPLGTTRSAITIQYDFDSVIAKTDLMESYVAESDKYFGLDNNKALEYANKALKEIEGDSACYFIYAKRSRIKRALGDVDGAEHDKLLSEQLKIKFDQKRIAAAQKAVKENESPFAYFNLSNAYDIAGDYKNAIIAIDKAISMTKLNQNYKRYKEEIMTRSLSIVP